MAPLTERFDRAFELASEVHRKQLRKSTEIPYIAHVMSVAALVLENGGSEDAAIGGLLHDAVEDSGDGTVMEARIRQEFGDGVADIVIGCSDSVAVPGQLKQEWRPRKESYLEHLHDETNADVLLVSACDKLHNARAIVTDLHNPSIGFAVWDRFTIARDGQLWYYGCLADSYDGRVSAVLSDELHRVVEQMRMLPAT